MSVETHEYTRDGVTVVWQPKKCWHSGVCARGLPAVFDPRRRPWVDMDAAELEAIVDLVGRCPSGALSIKGSEGSDPGNIA